MTIPHEEGPWVCILKTNSRFEAEAAKGNLEHASVPCVLLNKQDSSYLAFGYVELHVPASWEQRARHILDHPLTASDGL